MKYRIQKPSKRLTQRRAGSLRSSTKLTPITKEEEKVQINKIYK